MDLPSETTKRYKYADVLYSIIKMFKLKMADNLKVIIEQRINEDIIIMKKFEKKVLENTFEMIEKS